MTFRRRHDTLRSERGQTAVEFALIAPMLIVLLLGIVQGGVTFHHYIAITDAARAAARKAIVARVSGLTTADITQAADDAAGELNSANMNVTVDDPADQSLRTGGTTFTVTVTYPYSINLLGVVIASGNLTSKVTDRLE